MPLALHALGVATPQQIKWHFIRRRYAQLSDVLDELEQRGEIERVYIREWPGAWYMLRADAPLLERIAAGDWQPRTTLLSPFDNLICDRARTEQFFNFNFRLEIYTPKHKRQFGYYVLPILLGDRIIGRIDPLMDRARRRLIVNAVHLEPGAPAARSVKRALGAALEELAAFLGAEAIEHGST